jgi:lysine 2,3-aminomutase
MLSDKQIDHVLSSLRQIPHLQILRIGSRVPCFLPQRVTPKLVKILRKYHPLYINVHFNHPDELTPEAFKALGRLADAGIPLGNQTVLLKGVNDNPEVMKKLCRNSCRPAYAHIIFIRRIWSLVPNIFVRGLKRGWKLSKLCAAGLPELAVPHFVIDAPGGGGKIPLLPEYVQSISDEEVVMRNYAGKDSIIVNPAAMSNRNPVKGSLSGNDDWGNRSEI